MIFVLTYLLAMVIGYLLISYYYNRINLSFTLTEFLMLLIPLFNIGVVIGCLYCILTKRHYEVEV